MPPSCLRLSSLPIICPPPHYSISSPFPTLSGSLSSFSASGFGSSSPFITLSSPFHHPFAALPFEPSLLPPLPSLPVLSSSSPLSPLLTSSLLRFLPFPDPPFLPNHLHLRIAFILPALPSSHSLAIILPCHPSSPSFSNPPFHSPFLALPCRLLPWSPPPRCPPRGPTNRCVQRYALVGSGSGRCA